MRLWLFLALSAWPAASPAAVELSFHSRAFGTSFPHAFVVLKGNVDATGERVDSNFGFTLRHQIGPSVLLGPVKGKLVSEGRPEAAGGRRHFSLILSDEEYHRVMRLVERWRALPQPSYHLDRRNCVTFVAEVAAALGLKAAIDRATIRRPRLFLDRVSRENYQLIAQRGHHRETNPGKTGSAAGR